MNLPSIEDIMAEVAGWHAAEDRRPGEFTTREYADFRSISYDSARAELEAMVGRGWLAKREGSSNKRPAVLFSKLR